VRHLSAAWATPALVGTILAMHVVSARFLVEVGRATWVEALFLGRGAYERALVGGRLARAVARGDLWRFWTSALLHGDLFHLLSNALGLWLLGRIYEPIAGARRLLAVFVAGAVFGGLASHLWGNHRSDGASGGAFAWLGALVVIGLRRDATLEEDVVWLLGRPLQAILAVNLVLSAVLPFVDGAAHVGGLAVGLAAGLLPFRASRAAAVVEGAVLVGSLGVFAWAAAR
jgi:membrane associated rhomboid family serine protease